MNKGIMSAKIRPLLMPVSRSTPFKSAYSSMRNSKYMAIHVMIGVNGDTDITIGLMQAKNVNGASDKELIFSQGDVYQCDGAASAEADKDKWTESTVINSGVAGSVVNVAGGDNIHYIFYVHNDFLDADNNFDCVAVQIYGTSAACLTAVLAVAENARFGGDPSSEKITPSMAQDAGDKY